MAAIQSIHEKYMKEALKQARKALALGEVRRLCFKYTGNAPVQSPGHCDKGDIGGSMQRSSEDLFRRTENPQ